MNELILIFAAIGLIVVMGTVFGFATTKLFGEKAEAFTLKMVKMHYYDALGCKIDAGCTLMVKGSHKDFEKQVHTYLEKRFSRNMKIYWEILCVEDK
jgi:hypothetical protein